MATSSKGIRYPVASDAVAVHTDLQNLATDVDGLLNDTVASAKGDLVAHTGSINVRVPVGTNGHYLIADSTQSSGVRWGAAGFTVGSSVNGKIAEFRATDNLSTSITFSSIPSTYTNLYLVGRIANKHTTSETDPLLKLSINGTEVNTFNYLGPATLRVSSATGLEYGSTTIAAPTNNEFSIISIAIYGYNSSTYFKPIQTFSSRGTSGSAALGTSEYPATTAITSVTIEHPLGYAFWSGSTVELFGQIGV